MPKKLNSKEYEFRSVIKHCLYCGKKLKLNCTRDINRKKFCSRRCIIFYSLENGIIDLKGGKLSSVTKKKISDSQKRNGFWKGGNNPNYGGIITRGRKATQKEKDAARERMLNGGAAKARKASGGKTSSLEIKVGNYLREQGIDFKGQKIINNHAVDIFIEPDIIIECDGKYWHSLSVQIIRDIMFNKWCYDNKYCLIRLQEDEINNNQFKDKLSCQKNLMTA